MYPYATNYQWILASRYQHLVAATEGASARLPTDLAMRLELRRGGLTKWGKVRTALLAALYFGIIAATATWILDAIGLGSAGGLVQAAARITTGLAGLFAALFLLTNRLLGQLEIDLLAILALNLPDPASPAPPTQLAPSTRTRIRKKRETSRASRESAKDRKERAKPPKQYKEP